MHHTEIHHLVLSDQSTPFECEIFCKDNTRSPVEIRTRNMPLKDQQVSVTAMRDLTRQKEIEDEKERLLQENTMIKE